MVRRLRAEMTAPLSTQWSQGFRRCLVTQRGARSRPHQELVLEGFRGNCPYRRDTAKIGPPMRIREREPGRPDEGLGPCVEEAHDPRFGIESGGHIRRPHNEVFLSRSRVRELHPASGTAVGDVDGVVDREFGAQTRRLAQDDSPGRVHGRHCWPVCLNAAASCGWASGDPPLGRPDGFHASRYSLVGGCAGDRRCLPAPKAYGARTRLRPGVVQPQDQ